MKVKVIYSVVFFAILIISSSCIGSVKPVAMKKDIVPTACYLNPGTYYNINKLASAFNCRNMDKIPKFFINEIDFVSGQMKCGLHNIQLNSGAMLIIKVKVDMIVGMLVVTDGKCQIEYSILMLPKVK